jgi:outer membrane protein
MSDTVRRCLLGLVLTAFLLPPSAFGQSGQSGLVLPPAAVAPAQPEGTLKRLSIDEAVALALEQNLNLQVQRLDPQLQDLTIDQVKSAWTPAVSSTLGTQSATSPAGSFLSGATDQLVNDRLNFSVQANQFLPWGGNYNVTWLNNKIKSNSVFDIPNPALGSNLGGSYTQPLLRNFKIDSTRQQLLISKKNREMTDVQLRQSVLTTVRLVKNGYWNLAYAIENLKVQQQSLDIARESLRNNKSRVAIGTMAPIDIIEAEAEVARNEEAEIGRASCRERVY